ncbi:polyprenyl synthetase family protein [Salipaludibacillus agaradhaerens]|uniref:polyprenyl synthetase family protein n=1 Tax=Salipaludibacillus agaradhaerens TaxID=76935 RepID=UPI0021510B4E|nr:farnesyl diphosphate synthase [Salipaludibacillus agaradhaerens]
MEAQMEKFLAQEKVAIDEKLTEHITQLNAPESLKESMTYSLKAGGKRIRPILLLATLKGFGKNLNKGYDIACAIEMIHTYSLIHDDLPAMDDDDLRRGQPTNHKVFGEALAILAGDGLLTYSFTIVSQLQNVEDHIKIELVQKISQAAGPKGMVAGQVADMEAEGRDLDLEELQEIHHRKTGDLLSLSLECGALLAEASQEEMHILTRFGKHLGLAFQIKDDLLDVEGDENVLGKRVGSDATNEKNTYPKILGVEKAKETLTYHLNEAHKLLAQVDMDQTLLRQLTNYIGDRIN